MPPSATETSPALVQSAPVLYQVDCCVASSGKTVSVSKRRIRWRYGFANPQALDSGAVGVQARGSEHEITLIWSIASGKKKVLHDGKEIHYSQGRRTEGKFQYSWHANNHVYNMIAHVAPPRGKSGAWKQFELFIDGCSFYKLTRIFELGVSHKSHSRRGRAKYGNTFAMAPAGTGKVPRSVVRNSAFAPIERNPSSEIRSPEQDMNWSRSPHSMDSMRQTNSVSPDSMRSNHVVTPTSSTVSPQDLLCDETTNSDGVTDLLSATTPGTVDLEIQTNSSTNPFAYVADDEFNPLTPPSHEVVWHNIMSAYDCPDQGQGSICQSSLASQASEADAMMQNLVIDTSVEKMTQQAPMPKESPSDVTAMGSLEKLVNLDDISAPVFQAYNPTTCKNNSMAGKEHLPLAALKSESAKTGKAHPTREIMKTHSHQAAAHPPQYQQHQAAPGQLVVYGCPPGQQMYNNYGPPPVFHGSFR